MSGNKERFRRVDKHIKGYATSDMAKRADAMLGLFPQGLRNTFIDSKDFLLIGNKNSVALRDNDFLFEGLGSNHRPTYIRQLGFSLKNRRVGFEIEHEIRLCFHTDRWTQPQLNKLLAKYPQSYLWCLETFYYFRSDGRFAKVITLPEQIDPVVKGNQRILETHEDGWRELLVEPTFEDFNRATVLIQDLSQKVVDYLNRTKSTY